MNNDVIEVVHVCSSKGPTCSAQRILLEMNDSSESSIDHRVICHPKSWLAEELKARSIRFFSWKKYWGGSLQLSFQLFRLKPSLVHWYRVESVWLCLFLRLFGIRQVLTLTHKWSSQITPRLLLGLWLVDRIIISNPSLERSLARRSYCSFKPRTQIPTGIYLPPPGSFDSFGSKQEMAQKFGLNPDLFTVGVFIDGSKEKLDAFFKLLASSPELPVQWVVVTWGRISFKLRYLCKRHRVHLFEKEKAWRTLLKAMDVVYLPRENFHNSPFIALEALSLDVRLLSVPQGDAENLIYSGVTGYQLKRDHPEDLYKGLIYLLETPCVNRHKLMLDLLMSRYSKREMLQKLSLVYQEACHAHL